jgi:hypothetical protein
MQVVTLDSKAMVVQLHPLRFSLKELTSETLVYRIHQRTLRDDTSRLCELLGQRPLPTPINPWGHWVCHDLPLGQGKRQLTNTPALVTLNVLSV